MTMKIRCAICATIFSLAGCGQVQDNVPEPTAAQQQVAFSAYTDLQKGQYEQFLTHLEPELQQYFQDNQRVMKKFTSAIPKDAERSRTLMIKKLSSKPITVSNTKSAMKLPILKTWMQYDVSFDEGTNALTATNQPKIRNLNIQVFGE